MKVRILLDRANLGSGLWPDLLSGPFLRTRAARRVLASLAPLHDERQGEPDMVSIRPALAGSDGESAGQKLTK
jgi:hypothetical protein